LKHFHNPDASSQRSSRMNVSTFASRMGLNQQGERFRTGRNRGEQFFSQLVFVTQLIVKVEIAAGIDSDGHGGIVCSRQVARLGQLNGAGRE
jgi:hypothetical protein